MTEYQVYTVCYPITTITQTRIRIGELDKKDRLSKSINTKLQKLGKGWKVASISTASILKYLVFTILFEKP